MANHTQTFDEKRILAILDELEELAKAAKKVREGLLKVFPAKYGSDLWWEKETEKGIESIKKGKGKKFKSYDEAVEYLNS